MRFDIAGDPVEVLPAAYRPRPRQLQPRRAARVEHRRWARSWAACDGPIRRQGRTDMDWFEGITGFRERPYAETRDALSVVDGRLHAHGRDRGVAVGTLTLPSLAELRAEAAPSGRGPAAAFDRRGRRARHAPRAGEPGRPVPGRVAVQHAGDGRPRCDARARRDRLRGRSHAGAGLRGGGRRRHDLPQLPRARGGRARPDAGAADRRECRPPGRPGAAPRPRGETPWSDEQRLRPAHRGEPRRRRARLWRAPTRPRATCCAACCGSGCTAMSR